MQELVRHSRVVIFKFALGREQTPFRHRRGKKLFKRKTPSHISPFLAAGGRELLAMPSRQQQSVQLLAPWGHRVHQTRRFCYSREDELELDAAQIRSKDGEEKLYSPTECCVLYSSSIYIAPDPAIHQHSTLLVKHSEGPSKQHQRNRGDWGDVTQECAGGLDLHGISNAAVRG